VTWVMWSLVLVCLEIVLMSVPDSCTACTKHLVGSEIIFDTPDGTLGDEAQVEARFGPFGDSYNLDAR
jgi:hypothetical protein